MFVQEKIMIENVIKNINVICIITFIYREVSRVYYRAHFGICIYKVFRKCTQLYLTTMNYGNNILQINIIEGDRGVVVIVVSLHTESPVRAQPHQLNFYLVVRCCHLHRIFSESTDFFTDLPKLTLFLPKCTLFLSNYTQMYQKNILY